MTHYYYLDDSGDPGVGGAEGSSRYLVLAMVQLATREPLPALASVRRRFHLPSRFEIKYHKTTQRQKADFFQKIQTIPFRVRAVVIDKSKLEKRFMSMSGQELTIELITDLTLRASEVEIANDVLILDGVPRNFHRALRIRLSKECRLQKRTRPFKKIISADSKREEGLQLADMVAGAIRHYAMGVSSRYYKTFAHKVVDLWEIPARKK